LKIGKGFIFAFSRSGRYPSLSRNRKQRITQILLMIWPDTLEKSNTYNKLVPLEPDPNPIRSRTETDRSRNVGNEMDSLRVQLERGPDLDRCVHSGFHFRTPRKLKIWNPEILPRNRSARDRPGVAPFVPAWGWGWGRRSGTRNWESGGLGWRVGLRSGFGAGGLRGAGGVGAAGFQDSSFSESGHWKLLWGWPLSARSGLSYSHTLPGSFKSP